ncbi:MAG: class I SAM-dependent RNA methyltransferase [Bdellovibrionaceae bacterium]|nr:class I SAM-dependent RNA methyltransferase [Bdellovibrionales bacterium]MCB9085037.1 class I SAM-dependent RNA methyltransferase [Pseudobdellovibrionaceae bacterium]
MDAMGEFKARVRDLTPKGLGVIDHPDGRVVFVPGVWPGDTGLFRVTKMEKRYGFGDLIELIEPSPERRTPPCPHQGFSAGDCGGCPWMIATYEGQLAAKQKLVKQSLDRALQGFDPSVITSIQGSPQELGFRNRAQVKTDGQQIGFVSSGKKTLAPIKDCLILTDKNRQTLKELLARLPNSEWKPPKHFLWSFLEFDEDIGADEVQANQRRSFRQGNQEQNEYMQNWLREVMSPQPKQEPVLELFCGSGNFTEILSQLGFTSVLAIDSSAPAVSELENRHLEGVKTGCADLREGSSLKGLLKDWGQIPKALLLDPPRGGYPQIKELSDTLKDLEQIIYISCDVHAFAQDAKGLQNLGWQLTQVQPLDQFPHTPHIEILSLFSRQPGAKND